MSLFNLSGKVGKNASDHKRALCLVMAAATFLSSCADAMAPGSRNATIPSPKSAEERQAGVNEGGEPIIYLPLGDDVLMPQTKKGDLLPDNIVGPFELRGETLAGALQLITDGQDIPVAFESASSLTQTITVTNLRGSLSHVVNDVCSLANMYCSYQNGVLLVKDREIFTVTLPPIVPSADVPALLTNVSAAVGSITGEAPITDPSTRTIVYRASQRTAEMAARYFQRLRSNTAMIVYESYIWEVSLKSGNTSGIKWSFLNHAGRFNYGLKLAGSADTNVGTPISIGLPTTQAVNFGVSDILQFISTYGAVKTISQPQLTVLSGSTASLRIADKQNYVASISRTTTDGGNTTVSTTTNSVDTGFTLGIGSNWDNATVYGSIDILLQEVKKIDKFDANENAVVQLPQTTERQLKTQVRIRPGDMLLIAGLVRESDSLSKEGPGMSEPILPVSRTAQTANTELVFLLRPRVVVFTTADVNTVRKGAVAQTPSDVPASLETDVYNPEMSSSVAPPVAAPVVAPAAVSEPMPLTEPAPSAAKTVEGKPASAMAPSSLEIQPLAAVVDQSVAPKTEPAPAAAQGKKTPVLRTKTDPSVTVDYDTLGQ